LSSPLPSKFWVSKANGYIRTVNIYSSSTDFCFLLWFSNWWVMSLFE
jgi:hypothetical protein